MEAPNFRTLDHIVAQACTDIGDTQLSRYQQFLGWAFWQLREFHFDAAQVSHTRSFQMDSKKEVFLGNDFVDLVRVMYRHKNTDYLLNVAGATVHLYSYPLDRHSNYMEPLFIKEPSHYFTLDRTSGKLSFSSFIPTQCVIVEYISNGYCPNTETIVDQYIADYLLTAIHLKRNTFPKMTAEYETWMRNFAFAEQRARGRVLGLTEHELISAIRGARSY
jgi:hypothetical protein